jgi:hypothetical protein
MVVDGFDGAACEEPHRLATCHAGNKVCKAGAECIEEETLKWMIVERAIRVGNIETVVAGVECSIEPLVVVHCPVQPVLPGIHDEDA